MKYFFSSPIQRIHVLKACGVKNYLMSFAVDAKGWKRFDEPGNLQIIDSGAFSAWQKGITIDREEYKNFCLTLPQNYIFINLDKIPKTGADKKEVEQCCEEGYENYLYLKQYIENIMPVFHYQDDEKWLKRYAEDKTLKILGVSPANDTHGTVKREFLRQTYRIIGTGVKTHLLGYSEFWGLCKFPAYSVDSISWRRANVNIEGEKKSVWTNTAMNYLLKEEVRKFMNMESFLTDLWARRGVVWDN